LILPPGRYLKGLPKSPVFGNPARKGRRRETILRIVKRAKILQRKNPSIAAEAHPLPFFDPDYPVKPWIAYTGEHFQTVSVQLEGSYLAFILEDPSIRHTAKTRRAAENAVKRAYNGKRNPVTATVAELAGLIVIVEWEKPYYGAYVPGLDNISTYGKTRTGARAHQSANPSPMSRQAGISAIDFRSVKQESIRWSPA
jgi:hypothetical protein